MNQRLIHLLTICLAMLLTVLVHAPACAQEFQGQINFTKAMAENIRQMSRELEFAGKELGDLYTKDYAEMLKWCNERAGQWDKAASLFEEKKPQEAQTLMESFKGDYNRWREQLQCRQQQKRFAPDEKWLTDTRRWVGDSEQTTFNKFVEARKALSEEWGKLAAVVRPETENDVIVAAREKVSVANTESEIAEVRVNWERDGRNFLKDRALTPELDKKVSEITATEDQMAEMRRQRNELEMKLQQLDRKRAKLVGEANNLAHEARRKQENR
jgi:hypothetical protein